MSSLFFFAVSQEVVSFLKRMSPGHIAACSMSPACVRQASLALRMIAGEDGTSKGIFVV
jgi:7-keto-8-aminopelargonate synthetase-like enzyme